MKRTLSILVLLSAFGCGDGEENNTPTVPVDDPFEPSAAVLLREGTMVGSGHTVSGTVKVYDDGGQKIVVFDPFTSQNGPDLKVYLSTDEVASEYLNLGALKSTTGKQTYLVTGMPDFDEYKFVLIWCEQFSVLFGVAKLE
jgi:hypothetical protein